MIIIVVVLMNNWSFLFLNTHLCKVGILGAVNSEGIDTTKGKDAGG
jgi:hypothetical protein